MQYLSMLHNNICFVLYFCLSSVSGTIGDQLYIQNQQWFHPVVNDINENKQNSFFLIIEVFRFAKLEAWKGRLVPQLG